MSISIKVENITPIMAAEWFKKVDRNHQRNLRENHVATLAAIMRNGQWTTNHQGIAFDDKGRLMDGQHRLAAIVKSGVTVSMIVSRGWQDNGGLIMDTIDHNAKRTVGNSFQVTYGIKNANITAAIVRTVANICTRGNPVSSSPATAKEIYDWFKKEIGHVLGLTGDHLYMRKAVVLGTLAFCLRPMGAAMEPFVEQVVTGDGMPRNGPAALIRRYILNGAARRGINSRHVALAAMHFVEGNAPSFLRESEMGLDFFRVKQSQIVRKVRELHGFRE